MSQGVPPILVLGWGNPSRGDDAVGPLLVEKLAEYLGVHDLSDRVECLTDFQLQVEHAIDLVGRERVLFVDAELGLEVPFTVRALSPAPGAPRATHALSPEALLQVYVDLNHRDPPPCTQLGIRTAAFQLGSPPSPQALADLAEAVAWARAWLSQPVAAPPYPPPNPGADPDPEPTRSAAAFAPYWQARVTSEASGDPVDRLPEAFVCAACGSPAVSPRTTGAGGGVAGGEIWYDIGCERCGVVTEYLHEWG